MIEPAEASNLASKAIAGMRSGGNPIAAAAGPSAHAGEALLVRRSDLPDDQYYLVPMEDERGVAAVLMLDARTGKLLSAAAIPERRAQLLLSPEEAARLISIRLRARALSEPSLVWQPCRESPSPLTPFYAFKLEGGRAFVFSDGSVARQLTPFGKGG